jgi:hypothetical protein
MSLTPQDMSREVAATGFGADAWRDLVPLLRANLAPARGEVAAWLATLVAECRERLGIVLPLHAHEMEFLERLNGAGDIVPELLSDDAGMQALIRDHPGLKWKALNVRRRLGAPGADGEVAE